jgi:hypothetical protein
MQVSGRLDAPAAFLREKETLVPIGWEAGWGVKGKIPNLGRDSNYTDHPDRSSELYRWAILAP